MTLTVPTAGVTAGRAAQPRFEAPQTGAALAAFGQTVKDLGDRLEADRLDLAAGRLQLDMTRDLNALRLKYQAMGDPDAIDRGWAEDIGALRETYLAGTDANGRARVDPKLRDRFGLMFDDLAERHAFDLGSGVLALRQSQRVATAIEYEAAVATSAATAGPETRAGLYAGLEATYDSLVAAGAMTPEEAATAKLKARQTGEWNAFQTDMKDPVIARAGLALGAYNLSAEDRIRADTLLKTADEEARLAADKARTDALAVVKTDIAEGIKLARAGRFSEIEGRLDDPALQAEFPDQLAELRGAVAVRDAGVLIAALSPAELEALRADWKDESYSREYQTEGLKAIEARIAEVREGARADPIALWQQVPALAFEPIDFSDGGTVTAGLAERAADVKRLAASGHLDGRTWLSADETAKVRQMAATDRAPADRLAVAMSVQGAFGPDALGPILDDPTLSAVAWMRGSRAGNDEMARQILAGERLATENGMVMPSEGAWREVVNATLAPLFNDGTVEGQADETALVDQFGRLAFGLYVYRKGKAADPDGGTFDQAALEQAVHEVLGGTGEVGSRAQAGGQAEIWGIPTFLPPGVRGGDVEDALFDLKTIVQQGWGAAEDAAADAGVLTVVPPDDIWRELSVSGNVPRVEGLPIDVPTLDQLHLRASGGGGYEWVWTDPDDGAAYVVQGDDGQPYILDLYALLARTGGRR